MWEELMHEIRQAHEQASWPKTPPRRANESDYTGWDKATEKRTTPRTREFILADLRRKSWLRMHRLERDFKWMKRQMKKMGLNPEDAKELL